MTGDTDPPMWASVVAEFIARGVPKWDRSVFWDHKKLTAYLIGGEALAALGRATEKEWGARPLPDPRLPEVLPRWDDICGVVLMMARHQNFISYLTTDAVPAPTVTDRRDRQPDAAPSLPNILPAHGLGPARATPELMFILELLGLIDNGRWTESAELVYWREQPDAWQLEIATDPRFATAVDLAASTLPDDVHAKLDRLATIGDSDVARRLAHRSPLKTRWEAKASLGNGVLPHLPPHFLQERMLITRRQCMDLCFCDNWRIPDGWLVPEDRAQALKVFLDPLAKMMRSAIMAQLHPDRPWFAVVLSGRSK